MGPLCSVHLGGGVGRARGIAAMQALSIRENWVGLESNPEVLTEYAHKMGVSKCARRTPPAAANRRRRARRRTAHRRLRSILVGARAGAGALATWWGWTRSR